MNPQLCFGPYSILWMTDRSILPFGPKYHELLVFVILYTIKPTSKYFVHLPQIYAPSKRPGVRADFEGNQPKLVLHRVSYNPRQINYISTINILTVYVSSDITENWFTVGVSVFFFLRREKDACVCNEMIRWGYSLRIV